MNIFTDDSKEKFVTLFIENLQYGKIKINVEGLQEPLYSEHEDLKNHIKYLANREIDDHKNYWFSIKTIYNRILDLKLEGRIDGEFNDITTEEIINKLKLENRKLKEENEQLHNDNIILAGQLKDTQNIINRYEESAYKKDDKNESD